MHDSSFSLTCVSIDLPVFTVAAIDPRYQTMYMHASRNSAGSAAAILQNIAFRKNQMFIDKNLNCTVHICKVLHANKVIILFGIF